MKFRTLTLAGILSAALAVTAHAQNPQMQGAPGGARMSMADRALQGITLTDAQKASKDSIEKAWQPKLDSARAEMRAAREAGGDAQPIMAKMRETQQQLTAAIKGILTDDQKAAFDKNVEEMRARMPQGGGGRPPLR